MCRKRALGLLKLLGHASYSLDCIKFLYFFWPMCKLTLPVPIFCWIFSLSFEDSLYIIDDGPSSEVWFSAMFPYQVVLCSSPHSIFGRGDSLNFGVYHSLTDALYQGPEVR